MVIPHHEMPKVAMSHCDSQKFRVFSY